MRRMLQSDWFEDRSMAIIFILECCAHAVMERESHSRFGENCLLTFSVINHHATTDISLLPPTELPEDEDSEPFPLSTFELTPDSTS
jgi:hypothetical protein